MAFPGVRARGTVGGSIAHADPASELPAVLLALGGEVVARGPGGERTIPADDLFVTYFTTALQPDEVLTHVRFPRGDRADGLRRGGPEGGRLRARRRRGRARQWTAARAARPGSPSSASRTGRSGRPVPSRRSPGVRRPRRAADAARLASEEIDAKSDSHATAQYRRDVVGVLVARALAQAGGEG